MPKNEILSLSELIGAEEPQKVRIGEHVYTLRPMTARELLRMAQLANNNDIEAVAEQLAQALSARGPEITADWLLDNLTVGEISELINLLGKQPGTQAAPN